MPGKRKNPQGDDAPRFFCDCEERCGGVRKPLGETAYREHAKFRTNPLMKTIKKFLGKALDIRQPAPPSSNASGSTRNSKRRRVEESTGAGPCSGSAARRAPSPPPSSRGATPQRDPAQVSSQPPSPGGREDPLPPPQEDPLPFDDEPLPFPLGNEDEDEEPPQPNPEDEEEPPYGWYEATGAPKIIHLDDLKTAQAFVDALKDAKLEGSGLDEKTIKRMKNPRRVFPKLAENPVLRLALRQFIDNGHSEKAYRKNRLSAMEFNPEVELPTLEKIKKVVESLSGVVPIKTDMCPRTCIAYTGPYAHLESCPKCQEKEPRYHTVKGKRVARRTFDTHPFGPQAQALFASVDNAERMRHRQEALKKLLDMMDSGDKPEFADDVFFGNDYLDAVDDLIKDDHLTLMFSVDGAQLYQMKQSDCWIYVWVLLDMSPKDRYKKRYVLPGAVIPGPNKPQDLDSFLFPGLYHIAALQNDGLKIWDAARGCYFITRPIIVFATADTVAMASINGLVGHSGKYGCRLFCGMQGRHRRGDGHYYPAMLRPDDACRGNDHPDITVADIFAAAESTRDRYKEALHHVLASPNQTEYEKRRLATGVSGPSIFSGLPLNFGIPTCFPGDIMHHLSLNVTDIMIKLFRGTFKHADEDKPEKWPWAFLFDDDHWEEHGELIAALALFLPGSFDRPPRNIAKKMNSGYKAWEFLYYFYAVLPGLAWATMDPDYYAHYCKLVAGARYALLVEQPIALRAHFNQLLIEFVQEFEEKYYARRLDRLHFCRPSIHLLLHLIPECKRVGPQWLHSQWPMENAIGHLTCEICSHVFPFANLSERATRRCQVCALWNTYPELADPDVLPKGAVVLGDGYVLLEWGHDKAARNLQGPEAAALVSYMRASGIDVPATWKPAAWKWSRMLLPNGQIARSAFRECAGEARGNAVHRARMVKVKDGRFAEVQYFFPFKIPQPDGSCQERTLAMLSDFTRPDADIARQTHGVLLACRYQGHDSLRVIDAKEIVSVVGMVPLPARPAEVANPRYRELFSRRYFVVEKLGFDMTWIGRVDDPQEQGGEGGGDDT